LNFFPGALVAELTVARLMEADAVAVVSEYANCCRNRVESNETLVGLLILGGFMGASFALIHILRKLQPYFSHLSFMYSASFEEWSLSISLNP